MLDPATGKATVYKMPDPAAKDPHTMKFDKNNIMLFSLQNSNMIGRLDPKTGDIKLVKTAPKSQPYGVKIDADGTPWVSCNGRACLIKVDPATMALTEVALPEGSTVRRLDIAEDGMIWYVNSGLGRLGRLDPKTGEIKEWPSPSGPKSHPYAIAIVDGIVWYNESFQRPDALVRFDPKTETFQSWAIPSGDIYAGHVRHMRGTARGQSADPPEQHQPDHPGDAEAEVRVGAVSADICSRKATSEGHTLACALPGTHILKTPNLVCGIGAFSAAENASASTRRVSLGRMMPSSHSRAVA